MSIAEKQIEMEQKEYEENLKKYIGQQLPKESDYWTKVKTEALKKGSFEEAAAARAEEKKAHGTRYNDGKLKWSYMHYESMEPMIRVLMFGAQKYAPFNWQKGLKKDEILESMQRHLAKMMDGEENDPESGLNHIGHVMCNAMFWSFMDLVEKGKVNVKNEGN